MPNLIHQTLVSALLFASPALAQTEGRTSLKADNPVAQQQVVSLNTAALRSYPVPGDRRERALAAMMVGEARGEGEIGQLLVGEIALNRVDANTFYGSDVVEVVFRRAQFSCFNADVVASAKLRRLARGEWSGDKELDSAFISAVPLAQRLLAGERTGLLPPDAYHYAVGTPPWAVGARVVLVYRNHTFWIGVD